MFVSNEDCFEGRISAFILSANVPHKIKKNDTIKSEDPQSHALPLQL